jgi:hypothetical protein
MEINLSTPALLFPAISLLLLAFTNRFVVLANLIRKLHDQYQSDQHAMIYGQIQNLRRRVSLIRNMQAAGIMSMLLCVVCMFLLFAGQVWLGKVTFGLSLLLLALSLTLSLVEIWMSVGALNYVLSNLEKKNDQKRVKE